jgi:hypothetical protein
LHTHYRGRNSAPGYHCPGKILVEGRGVYCLNVGGVQIDQAVTQAFLAALEPAKLAATVAAAERLEADRETSLRQWRLGVERASYEAGRAERRYPNFTQWGDMARLSNWNHLGRTRKVGTTAGVPRRLEGRRFSGVAGAAIRA